MVFSSHLFLFYYLPLVLLLYYSVPLPRYRTGLLAIVSYGFYAWSNPPWALIMFASTLVDYLCGVAPIRLAKLRRLPHGDWPGLPPSQPRPRGGRGAPVFLITRDPFLLGVFQDFDFSAGET